MKHHGSRCNKQQIITIIAECKLLRLLCVKRNKGVHWGKSCPYICLYLSVRLHLSSQQVSINSSKAKWVIYVLPVLTTSNSPFCPHSVFMCFVWIWEQTAIISLYSINWLVCITETECVYCAVRTGYLNVLWVICFIWIWEQTAIISLYSTNWLVCITETECLLRGTDWVFKCNLGYMLYMDLRTNSDYFPIQH